MAKGSIETTPAASSATGRPRQKGLPMSVPPELRELFGLLFDPEHMLAIFQRILPPRASRAIRVVSCSAKPGRSEKAFRKGRLLVVYTVGIEVGSGPPREYVLLGVYPRSAAAMSPGMEERQRELLGHPDVEPFRELVLSVEELDLALFLFPLDPSLPGLGEITGPGGARLLESLLPECRAGAKIERVECELQHYKPFNRAVLRVVMSLVEHGKDPVRRGVYVKAFCNDQGETSHRQMAGLWEVAQRSRFLRVPEPLGYDPEQRLLVMSEAPGQRYMHDWVRRIKLGVPLPPEVDEDRLDRFLLVAALALGELQRSGLHPEENYTYQDELHHLRRDREHLGDKIQERYPEPMARFEQLMHRLEALAPENEPLVPAHGEYRHQQLVGDEQRMTLIDWDSFCLANPALDAARFLAVLREDSLEHPGGIAELDRLARTFRCAFLAPRPEIAPYLTLYEGLHMTKRMLHSFGRASRGEGFLEHIQRLATAAEALLDRVETGRAF
jgi:phosphotransferase family enzyme